MTTIAYRDGIIAYDSLIVAGETIIYNNYEKSIVYKDARFFITGSVSNYDNVLNDWFDSKPKDLESSGFVLDGGELFEFGYSVEGMWKERVKLDGYCAIGSGYKFAFAAMDCGASAEEAVMKASERCVYTGGKIRTFKIP